MAAPTTATTTTPDLVWPIDPYTRLLTPPEVGGRLSVHRWTAYRLVGPHGPLPSIKVRRSRRVVVADLVMYLGGDAPLGPLDLVDAWSRLITIEETTQRLRISRSQVYSLLSEGLPSISLGSATRIRLSDLALFIDGLRRAKS